MTYLSGGHHWRTNRLNKLTLVPGLISIHDPGSSSRTIFTMEAVNKQNAIDLSHHLSDVARARGVSPLKALQKYFGQPGIISLAGGLPSPAYFPFDSLSGEIQASDALPATPSRPTSTLSWLWSYLSSKKADTTISIPKYPAHPGDINLATTLQYSTVEGLPQLRSFIDNFVDKVYRPAYANPAIITHAGNTDGWDKVVHMLCNPGEGVLVDVFTYATVLAQMQPAGYKPIPVDIDFQGMLPHELVAILSNWDEVARGMPRPHVLYQVPVGQNPTGMTTGSRRKKELYDICVEFDIIIVEDDPYYFLQEGPYVPKAQRQNGADVIRDPEHWIETLSPSYLRFDHQGRVIRLDSFSKTIAPGSRLGWYTGNPIFIEKLQRNNEVSSFGGSAFSSTLISTLLNTWGHDGYVRWLLGIRNQYTERRNFLMDCMHEEFSLQASYTEKGILDGALVYLARNKSYLPGRSYSDEKSNVDYGNVVFSVVPPTSGMFVWVRVNFENHANYSPEFAKTLEMKLWTDIAEAGVLFAPGWMFNASGVETPHEGHYRISFSNASTEDMRRALQIFAQVIRKFFV